MLNIWQSHVDSVTYFDCICTHMHTHVQDADKEEPHECGIERYFYTPIPEGSSCLHRQVRGYEVEVLPKNIPLLCFVITYLV